MNRLEEIKGKETWDWDVDDFLYLLAEVERLQEREALLKKAGEALQEDRENINWMLNSRQFLNPSVFNYLDTTLTEIQETPK